MNSILFILFASFGICLVAPPKCPNFEDIHDKISIDSKFNSSLYQGHWFVVAHNEPTMPSMCKCDIMTWTINPKNPSRFIEDYSSVCITKIHLGLGGLVNPDKDNPAIRPEGSPPLAGEIPNMVLYVEKDKNGGYSAAIVFSCAENYMFRSVFSSLQIFSRTDQLEKDKIDLLVNKAASLLEFDRSSLRYPQDSSCQTKDKTH